MSRPPLVAALLSALLLADLAHAEEVVVTPLLSDGVDAKALNGVYQLVSSELEFAPGVTRVVTLSPRPPQLDARCQTNPTCLLPIVRGAGGTGMITGTVHNRGGTYGLELIYYSLTENRIVRSKEWSVPTTPTEMSNAMTPIIRELLTGDGETKSAAGATTVAAFNDLEDLEDEPDPPAVAPVPIVRPAPAPAPVAATPPTPTSVESISFGGSPADITSEQIDSIQFGAPTAAPPTPPPAPVAPPPAPATPIASLDDPGKTRAPKEPKPSSADEQGFAEHLQASVRAGYANYYSFQFVTAGLELAVPLVYGLHAAAGFEVYNVKRTLPPDLALETGLATRWESMAPLNLGAYYKLLPGTVQPYVGADAIFVRYYKDEVGADWAAGVRARFGSDFMVSSNFGLNLNVATGMWSGRNWGLIEQGVGNSGFLPQVSAGTVLAF